MYWCKEGSYCFFFCSHWQYVTLGQTFDENSPLFSTSSTPPPLLFLLVCLLQFPDICQWVLFFLMLLLLSVTEVSIKKEGKEMRRRGCKLHIMWHYMPMHIQRIPIEGSCQKLSALLIKSKLSSPNVFCLLLLPQSFQLIWMSSTSCNILRMHAWTLKYFLLF